MLKMTNRLRDHELADWTTQQSSCSPVLIDKSTDTDRVIHLNNTDKIAESKTIFDHFP